MPSRLWLWQRQQSVKRTKARLLAGCYRTNHALLSLTSCRPGFPDFQFSLLPLALFPEPRALVLGKFLVVITGAPRQGDPREFLANVTGHMAPGNKRRGGKRREKKHSLRVGVRTLVRSELFFSIEGAQQLYQYSWTQVSG